MKKKIHIEMLRIMAIYFVMYNHTQNGGYFFFAENPEDPLYFFSMSASVLCKVAVPIFFMISGALLLKKEESLKDLFIKRVLKYALTLAVFSLVYYLWLSPEHSVADFLTKLYSTDITTGLWYLYSYIGILLMLPLLRKLAAVMSEKDYMYLFYGYLVLVGFVPMAEWLIWEGEAVRNPSFSAVLLTTENLFYVLLGYYCENVLNIDRVTRKKAAWMCIASFAAIAATCFVTQDWIKINGSQDHAGVEQFFKALICVPSVSIYVLMRRLCAKGIHPKAAAVIVEIGGAVFGAYLFEKLIRSCSIYVYGWLDQIIGTLWASMVWVAVGMTAGLLFVALLRRLPFVGKYVRKVI